MPAIRCCPRCDAGWPEAATRCGRCGASLTNAAPDNRAVATALAKDWWAERTNPRELRLMGLGAVLGTLFQFPFLVFSGFDWRLMLPPALAGLLVVVLRLNHLASMLVGLGSFLLLSFPLIGLYLNPFAWLLACGASAGIAFHADHRRSLGTRSGWGAPDSTTVVPVRPEGAPPTGPS